MNAQYNYIPSVKSDGIVNCVMFNKTNVSVLYLACTIFNGNWNVYYLAWIWFGCWFKSYYSDLLSKHIQ